jgi:hypothetical protein
MVTAATSILLGLILLPVVLPYLLRPGHLSIGGGSGRLVIYSRGSAMDGASTLRTPWGYLCIRFPVRKFGR